MCVQTTTVFETICAYKHTGIFLICPNAAEACDALLRLDITPPIWIASHLAQSVGPGASSVGLGEGAKPGASAFVCNTARLEPQAPWVV